MILENAAKLEKMFLYVKMYLECIVENVARFTENVACLWKMLHDFGKCCKVRENVPNC